MTLSLLSLAALLVGSTFPSTQPAVLSASLRRHALAEMDARQSQIRLLDYTAAVPKGWTSRSASSSMRLAEFSAASTGGASGAEIVVYYFGAGQGGPVAANLERWKSQFSNPSGGAVYERITKDTSAPYPLTIAEYRGSYARGVGMGASVDKALPNHILIAAVAETQKGTLFFQMYGPAAAVDAERATYLAFVRSLK